jgi:hypothetical protein
VRDPVQISADSEPRDDPPGDPKYLFESKNEAAPFSRAQRSLVYQRAKNEDKQPFGTFDPQKLASA